MKNTERRLRRALCVLLALALPCVLCLVGCSEGQPAVSGGDASVPTPAASPLTAASYDDIYDKLSALLGDNGPDSVAAYGAGMMTTATAVAADDGADMMVEEAAPAPAVAANGGVEYAKTDSAAGESGYSTTNVQVKGVDEGDVIKTDGRYIYILRGSVLTIVDAESLTELSSTKLVTAGYGSAREMYLDGDRVAVISSYSRWYREYWLNGCKEEGINVKDGSQTDVLIYDVTDRAAPKLTDVLSQDGDYSSSRYANGFLYCVTGCWMNLVDIDKDKPETYVPCVYADGVAQTLPADSVCCFPECSTAYYSVITSMSLNDCAKHASTEAALGQCGTIYSDGEVLLISAQSYKFDEQETKLDGKNAVVRKSGSETELMLYTLSGGETAPVANATLKGALINQFAIDRYEDHFRFVTTVDENTETIYTDGLDKYEYEGSSRCALYILDAGLNPTGSIEDLAEGERVYSVRFDGDTAYFVTFRQTDPLFCADVSDPAAPKILSALKINGFSDYLHLYSEGRLFGLGYDADDEGRVGTVKLSMFDTTDPTNVTEFTRTVTDYGWSEALYNHKAILVDSARGLIAFPADNKYIIFSYSDENGFARICEIGEDDRWHSIDRGMFIGDSFYVCTEEYVARFDMAGGYAETGRLTLSELEGSDLYGIIVN